MNSLVPIDYHTTLMLPDTMKIKKIGIAGVDVNGIEDRHGPFKVGKESGSKASIVPIKWSKVRKAYKADKKARKAKRKAKRKTRKAAKQATKGLFKNEIVNLDVTNNAVYRITHDDLLAKDIDLKGFNAKRIAISFKGEGVARHIEGLNKKAKWTKESYIEFKGEKPQGQDALYLSANNYRLSLNKKLVVDSDSIEPVTAKELLFETNKIYGWTSPGDDPFFDKLFYTRASGQTAQVTRTFDLNEVLKGEVKVTAYVGAYSNVKHHLKLSLNGSQVAEVSADAGWKDMPIEVTVDADLLQKGSNSITVTTMGESDAFDVYTYDKVVIAYDNGEAQESQTPVLSLSDKIKRKSINPKRGTDYVIVSHPMFMTEALTNYISQKESEGWHIHLVNVEDIYAAYGYGMATPESIKSYLKVAKRRGVTHVQLVGSASYDYLDTLGLGSVSFIGSAYVMTGSMTRYTPSDSYLVANAAGIPQMAIGRWPVRAVDELEAVVNKSLSWKNSGQSLAHSALFIADKNEEADFGKQEDALAEQFKVTGLWNDNIKVYFDAYVENNNGDESVALEAARSDIQQALNNGASITSFSGHSSLSTWSFKGMLKANDIAAINNTDRTTIALPLACYATYADSPSINTLAHQFLSAGENGAVAVYGAASLSDFTDNGKSAAKVIEYLLKGETIGEAIRKTKVDLGVGYIDVIRNSNLLGDVTIRID